MRQVFKRVLVDFKRSSFLIVRLLCILFSCAYCEEENSFGLQGVRSLRRPGSLSTEVVQLLINNGDEYTSDKDIYLTFNPTKDADEMFISFDANCSTGSWEDLATDNTKVIELRELNQKNTIYVKYRFRGQEETQCVGDSIIHDGIPPEVDFVNPPRTWIAETELNIGVNAQDSGSGVKHIQCDKQGNGQFEVCDQSVMYQSLEESRNYLLVVRAQDNAGNFSRPKQVNWRSDQTSPTLSLSLGPAALTADITPDFSFIPLDTGSGISRLECRVDNESQFKLCRSEFSLSGLSDGPHSVEVKAVDNVGRVSQPVSHSWTQDTTAPTIQFTQKPDAISKDQNAGFQFAGINDTQGIVSYQCQLDGGARGSCVSPRSLTGLSDGEHGFSVIGSDAVGNSSSPIIYRWFVDSTKPTLVLVEKPRAAVNVNQARFTFHGRDNGSGIKGIQYKVDGGAYQVYQNSIDLKGLSEGSHSLTARSEDRAGNFSDEVSYQWVVDQTRPTIMLSSQPTNPTNSQEASFSFESRDSGSGVEQAQCRLDGGSFENCDDSYHYTELSEGEHMFSVRVRDHAGNTSTVQTYSWSIDMTGPSIELTQKPEGIVKEQKAGFQFAGVNNEEVSSYKCQVDGGSVEVCTSPRSLTGLSDGEHRFSVIGLDALDNQSEPVVYVWTIDTVNPTLSFTEKPGAAINSKQAHFVFDARDSGSGLKEIQCKVDGGSYQVCPNPADVNNLLDGSHTFMAYSVDRAGNTSSVQTHTWRVDTVASGIQFTQKPDERTRSQSAVFQFSEVGGQNDIRSYKCQLDGGALQTCTSAHNLTSLSDGAHSFSVTGLDALGNRSSAITHAWVVDSTRPTLSFSEKPGAVIKTDQARFAFNAQDSGSGLKEIQCKVDSRAYGVCPNPMNVTNLSEGRHTLRAKAVDNAGNVSDEISHQWSVDRSLPVVRITSSPNNPTRQRSASFAFSVQDRGGSIEKVECRLDSGSFGICQDTKSYRNLSDGEHNFSVRAEDGAGNVSSVETYTWVIDTTAPTLQFSTRPSSPVYIGQAAQIQFSADDGSGSGVKNIQCLFNGGNYSCSGGTTLSLSATSTRENSFQVTVFDNAGNQRSETLSWQTKIEAVSQQVSQEVLEEVPVDILFVVDTSGSMDAERANLADKIDGFIEQIQDMDWQIAATAANITDNREHTRGKLTDFDNDANTSTHVLDSSMDIDEAQELFGTRIQGFPNGGDNREAGIAAAYQAITRYINNESPHRQFFREGAHLAIVVLSDEQAQGGVTPQGFINYVNQSFSNKTIAWHSIVNNEGTRYTELSMLTGGEIGNVGAGNYTSQLTTMGEAVRDMQKEVNLGCVPLDDDLDGNIDMEVRFKALEASSYQTYSGNNYTVQGQELIFDDYLDPGDYQFNFKCARN